MSVTLSHLKPTAGERTYVIFVHVAMILFALTIMLPLLYIIQLTFSTTNDATFRVFPKGFTLSHYRFVLSRGMIIRPFLNSVYLTFVCTVISVGLTILLAYPLSRTELVGRRTFNFLLILPMMISLGFLPRFLLVRGLGLLNTYYAIILTTALSSYNTIIMRNYFQHLPESIIDSARIDGCSELRILINIIIPISKPVIATISLFYMMTVWNKYFDIVLYISDIKKHTLQVMLRSMIMEEGSIKSSTAEAGEFVENIQYTTIVAALIPVMIVYPFIQKYFTKGIMLGSVKG